MGIATENNSTGMSAESKKFREDLVNRLSDLDSNLGTTASDMQMLRDVQASIGRLLDEDDRMEPEVRAVLQQRFEAGQLRDETYQLVKSVLDRYSSENVPTSPSDEKPMLRASPGQHARMLAEKSAAASLSSTTVLPGENPAPLSAEESVQVGSVLRDRFMLQEKVSGGSMGVVYKALDRRLAEAGSESPWVAIKVLSPAMSRSGPALRALQQEAAKGRCLTHPNIVRFLDLDRDDDLYFIIMEWLDGRTLADILDSAEGKSMPPKQALDIVQQIGSALGYAHRCGIIHADVKPGNIMIRPDGTAMLFDFGVARVQQTQTKEEADEFNPGVLGALTPAYSSMQVLTGEEPIPADDVFSLGCLMYRLVAGYRVFGPRNAAEAAEAGMKPQPLANIPDAQWRALKKAISYSRVTRYEFMQDFLNALDEPGNSSDAVNSDISIVANTRRSKKEPSSSGNWLFGLVVLLGLLGFAGYQFGLVDLARDWLDRQLVTSPVDDVLVDDVTETEAVESPEIVEAVPLEVVPTEPVDAEDTEQVADDVDNTQFETAPLDTMPAEPAVIDYTQLPAADVEIPLSESVGVADAVPLILREDGDAVVLEFVRGGNLSVPMTLRIEEVSYTGNRSPWASGQFDISGDGRIEFPTGQDRARVTLSMASDPLREADQLSTLRIREFETTTTQLAAIEVLLEDDDQRIFEAGLPVNTIAFAVSQVAVRERDPAVQVDILRFNPDDQPIVIGYSVGDITATEGEDYFSTGGFSVSFGPGQRTARLLIPLVQDSLYEGDEAFTVELSTPNSTSHDGVYDRIVVVIRDDENLAR